jgi:hypothetical protein
MNDGTVSFADRVRAGLASLLANLAAGARRLEHWSARGTRPILLSVLAVALLAFGALAVVSGGHLFGGWRHHGPPRPAWGQAGPPPKPHGGPEQWVQGRERERERFERGFEGRSEAKPERKPEASRPPGPPPAPGQPAPPPPPGISRN